MSRFISDILDCINFLKYSLLFSSIDVSSWINEETRFSKRQSMLMYPIPTKNEFRRNWWSHGKNFIGRTVIFKHLLDTPFRIRKAHPYRRKKKPGCSEWKYLAGERKLIVLQARVELYPRNVEIVNPFVSLQHLRVRIA